MDCGRWRKAQTCLSLKAKPSAQRGSPLRNLSRGLLAATFVLVFGCMIANTVRAQATATQAAAGEKVKLESTGLSLASSEAGFYISNLNLKQSLLSNVEKGWIAELQQVPYVQELVAYIKDKWENPDPQTRQAKNYLTSPIARDIMLLLTDMSAQECFILGEKNWSAFFKGVARFQYETATLNGEDPEVIREYFLALTKDDLNEVPIPTTVIGFQLSEDGNARTQLDALEGILQLALSSVDQLKPFARQLKRKDLDKGQTLSMTFRADDIPWESIPIPNADAQEIMDHLADLIAGRKLVITIGVLNNRLLIALSESPDTLTELGKADSLLSTAPFKQLAANQPGNLRVVSYTSGPMRDAANQLNLGKYFERLALQVTTPLEAQFDSDEFQKWKEKLVDDCEWLDDKLMEMMPKYKAIMGYAFEAEEGLESYIYDFSPPYLLENAQPLQVASHAGSGPLVLMATRQTWLKGSGEVIEAVLAELPEHIELIKNSGILDEDQADKFEEVASKALPILKKFISAFREKVIGGMDGNESVMAVTAQTEATKLNEFAPPPPAPLPLIEIGFAAKLKNKDLFLSGCDQVVESLNELIALIGQQAPNMPPGIRIPKPDEESMPGGGTRYYFPMGAPEPWDQFELQLAVNSDVAVFGYSTRQIRDMYQARPLAARPGWYSDDSPIASVTFIDFAGIFAAIRPWVQYGLSTNGKEMDEPLGEGPEDMPMPSGNDVLQIWDCFRKLGKSAGTVTVDKNGVTVTRSIWVGE